MKQPSTNKSRTGRRYTQHLKRPSRFSHHQLALFVIAFALIGYLIYHSLAAAPLVASLEAEQMTLPAGASAITDPAASGGKAIKLTANGTATGSVNFPSSVTSLTVMAKGAQCSGAPTMTVALDGASRLTNTAVSATIWSAYSYTPSSPIASGTHSLSVSFNNAYSNPGHGKKGNGACTRALYLDITNFYGQSTPPPPAPTVALSASPTSVTAGQSATLTWNSTNATSCLASGSWTGSEPTSGSVSTGALNQTSTYSLTCTGSGGSATASTTVTVTTSGGSPSSIYWGGYLDGDQTYSVYYGNPAPNGQNWQDAPWGNTGNTWDRFEQNTGKKMSIDHYGQPNPWLQTTFYGSTANIITNRGAIPMIDMDSNSTPLSDIANGVYDSQIRTWAANVKAWGKPFFFRWNWEMNGAWFNWGAQAQSNPALYVKSWQHFHDVVAAAGASNVTWVWCPNVEPGDGVSFSSLYPGDSYVDWTCLDGYNMGGTSASFATIYQKSYTDLLAVAPTKPIMIGEVASLEYGSGVKANWITDMLSTQLPKNFPKIKAMVWFNWKNPDAWPIESSSTSQAAFKTGIASSYYAPGSSALGNLPLLTKVPAPQ